MFRFATHFVEDPIFLGFFSPFSLMQTQVTIIKRKLRLLKYLQRKMADVCICLH